MSEPTGRFSYEGLDRVLHEKARLGILMSLSTHRDGLSFVELRQLCGLTDGNLSKHLDALADEKKGPPLVEITKGHHGRRPMTRVRLTEDGRQRFLAYLGELERVLRDARSSVAEGGPALGHA